MGLIIRDWKKSAAQYDASYPQQAIVVVPIPLWDDERVEQYLLGRIAAHTAEVVAPCTPKERWQGDTVYAVHKTVAGAIMGEVQVRPGHPNRCLDWCAAAPWCKQFQDEGGGQ